MMRMAAQHGYAFASSDSRDVRDAGMRARRVALSQMRRRGCLAQDAPLLGETVPRSLWFDRTRGHYADQHRRRTIHIADAFVVDEDSDQTSDELVPDTTRQELMAWSDLRQLLETGGLTPRQAEALDERASGVAVTDRHLLARAQARAQRIMAGPIRVTWPRLTRSYCWTEV
jgi:hypothetical protein